MSKQCLFLVFFAAANAGFGEVNPFVAVRDRYQWAIEQVMAHKAPEKTAFSTEETTGRSVKGKRSAGAVPTPRFQTQTYWFQTETDKAKVNVEVTDFGGSFLVDVSSDQAIEGWLLKRQSTRDVFLKGAGPTDNPYQCRIRVDRPYLKDFGLTVYVTEDNDPAFIQLF